jgi:transcriptional regulator with XRE-family HTH domain
MFNQKLGGTEGVGVALSSEVFQPWPLWLVEIFADPSVSRVVVQEVIPNIDKSIVMSMMRIIMPAKPPETSSAAAEMLFELGKQIRAQRKSLRVSAVAAAESATMSRVTLHRIERGEPSVTMGAYLNAIAALGMELSVNVRSGSLSNGETPDKQGWIPARINLENYPQLKQLSWQVQGTSELKPAEAFDIYERNWRHVETSTLEPQEQHLIDALRLAFGDRQRDI